MDHDGAELGHDRKVLGEVISTHLGAKQLNTVFPGFENDARKFPGLVKA